MQDPMTAFSRFSLVFISALLLSAVPAFAQGAEHLSLSADSVRFYGDRFLLEADGNVRVQLDHRYTIVGHTFSMDLRLNRFVVAGNVRVMGPDTDLQGAGFGDFIDTRRIYFVPLLDQPDRWTFENMDFAHPFKGREMPGDPFFLPDVSNSRVTVKASSAEIQPATYARFRNAQILSVGVMIPVPSYVINFSNSPDFRQNSLAGAIFDAPYDFFGDAHWLSTMHLRYDQTNKTYASFEQHYSSKGGWLVGSVNPATNEIKQYNIIGLARAGTRDQAYGFFQAIADQPGFGAAYSASAFQRLQLTHVLRQSFLQLDLNQNWDSLLPQPSAIEPNLRYYYIGDPSHPWVPMHPFNGLLTWQGMDHPIGHLPLNIRLRSAFGWAHDNSYGNYSYGLQSFDGRIYNSTSYQNVDTLIYSKPIRLHENTYLNFSFEKNRQWFSLPHFVDTSYGNASVSRTFGSKVALYAGYTIYNVGDYYGAKQRVFYPVVTYVSPVDGQTYSGFSAFQGFATYRSVYASAVFAPTPDFALNILLKKNTDFPGPIPGVLGNPPYQAFGDLRVRISPHASVDISRNYSFNFGNVGWSPTFSIQVLP
jgi:hypothetical protein